MTATIFPDRSFPYNIKVSTLGIVYGRHTEHTIIPLLIVMWLRVCALVIYVLGLNIIGPKWIHFQIMLDIDIAFFKIAQLSF